MFCSVEYDLHIFFMVFTSKQALKQKKYTFFCVKIHQ